MAIKQAQYKITLQNGEDIYHFQTDDNMVKIVDGNKNVLGTFKEYGMEGKVVSSGSYKTLKITGIYKVKGLTGLPSGFDVDKISILSVKAVGAIGNPEFVSYELISQRGEVFHNTVIGTTETGWTSGGTSLKNTISTITTQIGSLSSLKTTAKANLVNAVNEVKASTDALNKTVSTLTNGVGELETHNHDNRYLKKTGDTISGDLTVANSKRLRSLRTTGASTNLIGLNNKNEVLVGEAGLKMLIAGSDITLNGKKVWHENNDGVGSGLDADKLGGIAYQKYVRTDVETKFDKSILSGGGMYASSGFYVGNSWSERKGGLTGDASGNIKVLNNANTFHTFKSDGTLHSLGYHELVATNKEIGLRLKLTESDEGMGFYRNHNTKDLMFANWGKSEVVAHMDMDDSQFYFRKNINVQGRKMFLQSATPTGTIPTGSIWIA